MGTIAISQLNLIDNFPGVANPNLGIPTNGWDNTVDNFVTTAADTPPPNYPIGTKITAYSDNSVAPGYYTMAYLAYHCFSSAVGVIESGDISIGVAFCSHYDGSDAVLSHAISTDGTIATTWYVMASCENDIAASDVTKGGALAIPCATISAGESSDAYDSGYGDSFGWFWVGGVCPVTDVTLFEGDADTEFIGLDLTTDLHVLSGPFLVEYTAATGILESAGVSTALDLTDVGPTCLPFGCAVGYACCSNR